MKKGNRFFRCWNSGGHGSTDVLNALRVSCDVYFYDLSLKMNLDRFCEYAKAAHLYGKTGIDLPNERNGFFPTTAWIVNLMAKLGNRTQGKPRDRQGEVLNTPIHTECLLRSHRITMWTQPIS
jgi:penicillin-binding protein 2